MGIGDNIDKLVPQIHSVELRRYEFLLNANRGGTFEFGFLLYVNTLPLCLRFANLDSSGAQWKRGFKAAHKTEQSDSFGVCILELPVNNYKYFNLQARRCHQWRPQQISSAM